MKSTLKATSIALALLLGTTSFAAAVSVESLPAQPKAPNADTILVADDDDDDRRYPWLFFPHPHHGGWDDDRWDDDDYDDDDDDDDDWGDDD